MLLVLAALLIPDEAAAPAAFRLLDPPVVPQESNPPAGALTREDEVGWLRAQLIRAEWQAEREWAFGGFFGAADALVATLLPGTFQTADVRWVDVRHGGSAMDQFFNEYRRRSFRVLGGLRESELVTIGVELGLEDVDQDRLWRREKKVVIDAMRRAYKHQLGVPSFHFDEMFEMASGQGLASFALVPAVVGGYAYHQGIDRSIEAAGLRMSFEVKKLKRVFDHEDGDDPLTMGGLHVRPKGFFFGLVATVELEDGYQAGFVGIATDMALVYEAIEGLRGPEKD